MKKIYKIIIALSVIFTIIFGFIVVDFFIIGIKVIRGPLDITDIPCSFSISYAGSGENFSIFSEDEKEPELEWYGTLEEALENDELLKDKEAELGGIDYRDSNVVELLRMQTDDYLAVFYSRLLEEGEVGRITYVISYLKDGKISQPITTGMFGNGPGYSSPSGRERYIYDCDDGVVFYIEQEILIERIFGLGESRIPICFGMWENESEIRSLTVAGKAPKIIPVVGGKETRYFWYFEDLEWLDRLKEVNWGNYTYGDIINLLEIEYEPSNE